MGSVAFGNCPSLGSPGLAGAFFFERMRLPRAALTCRSQLAMYRSTWWDASAASGHADQSRGCAGGSPARGRIFPKLHLYSVNQPRAEIAG